MPPLPRALRSKLKEVRKLSGKASTEQLWFIETELCYILQAWQYNAGVVCGQGGSLRMLRSLSDAQPQQHLYMTPLSTKIAWSLTSFSIQLSNSSPVGRRPHSASSDDEPWDLICCESVFHCFLLSFYSPLFAGDLAQLGIHVARRLRCCCKFSRSFLWCHS